VFDVLRAWEPKDFESNEYQIDYDKVGKELIGYMDDFMPLEFTLDQFNSIATLQMMRKARAHQAVPQARHGVRAQLHQGPELADRRDVQDRPRMGLIHAPYMELAELELKFLQDLGNQTSRSPDIWPRADQRMSRTA